MRKVQCKKVLVALLTIIVTITSIPVTTNAGRLIINVEMIENADKSNSLTDPESITEEEYENKKITYSDITSDDCVNLLNEKGVIDLDSNSTLPSSVDLSKSEFFPEIEAQLGGTCCAFATAYYQYSYEAGKISKNPMRCSPYYPYTYMSNYSIGSDTVSRFLKERGCILYNQFVEKDPMDNYDYNYFYAKDVSAMRDALNLRLDNFYEYTEFYNGNTGPLSEAESDAYLKVAKTLLASGKVLVSGYSTANMITDNFYLNPEKTDYEEVVYRINEMRGSGHASVIVGYDDEFWVDINRNEIKEDSEKGAFKIVNSWGKGAHNGKGYFWVLYDAVLNEVSAIPATGEAINLELEKVYLLEKK